jgi:hypothetical protein
LKTSQQISTQHMTKTERSELVALIHKRERVLKSAADERETKMMAEFETLLATVYSFDDDAVWKAVWEEAQKVCAAAKEQIKQRSKDLGIPAKFAPGIDLSWYGRGENAVKQRREELRRAGKAQIAAKTAETKTQIERMSLEAQTEIVAHGIQSDAARTFLERMPPIETLMPAIDIQEVKKLITHRESDGE